MSLPDPCATAPALASPGKIYGPICGAQWGGELRRADLPWMTPATAAVAYTLATYANKSGANAHPGVQNLAHHARVTPRTVKRVLVLLRQHGWLWRSGTGSGAGRGHTGLHGLADTYMLTCPEAIGPRLMKPQRGAKTGDTSDPSFEAKTGDTSDPSFSKRGDTSDIKEVTPAHPHQFLEDPSVPFLRKRVDTADAARPKSSVAKWDYQGRTAEDFAAEFGLLERVDTANLNAIENMMTQGYNPTRIVAAVAKVGAA